MEDSEKQTCDFHEMELDDRILKAVAKLGWQKPTLVQEKAIPLLIEGKDVLMRARTGSGKTAAFTIPTIQSILTNKQVSTTQETSALILAPSRELCSQIYKVVCDLTIKCSREVTCLDISGQIELSAQRPLLLEKPDIVISTPTRALQHIKAGNLNLQQSLKMLVVDEADLTFSFGYENEIKQLLTLFPKIYQAVLASATLSEDVKNLKSLMLRNSVTLKLEEPDLAPASQLQHYHLAAEEMDKATILCALLKLHLVRGKTIIFVRTVDRCYKIKLFLEQFGLPACVLNSELPAMIRCHAVTQFNQGLYDLLIASDEACLEKTADESASESKQTGSRKKDKESGVSRGIDFQCVSNIINFDFPLDLDSYVHRAGRTARGNNSGSVLSFVSIRERPLMEKVERVLSAASTTEESNPIKAYQFRIEEVEAFKYRAKDAWKAATRIAVREARLREIKQEVFNSKKLKGYFEDNPHDLQALRHDKPLRAIRKLQHLTDVPDYIVPPALKNIAGVSRNRRSKPKNFTKTSARQAQHKRKMSNPLIAMEFTGFGKKSKKN